MSRFELRNGKFGDYFYDAYDNTDLPLSEVLIYLNLLDAPKEPELKKIDMSRCIESGIDCEFGESEDFSGYQEISQLHSVSNVCYKYNYDDDDRASTYCRPRMNHIHACPDGFDECPIPEGFVMTTWLGDGGNGAIEQRRYLDNGWKNIRMFKITGIADGWEL